MSGLDDMFSPGAPAPASAPPGARDGTAPSSTLTKVDPSPLQAPALVPAEPPAKKKRRLGFKRLATYVAEKTGDFTLVIDAVVGIVEHSTDARDRIKAAEFLAKWTEANPATVRHVVTGPGGKPIQHLHGHVHRQQLPDLSKFSLDELKAWRALTAKAAGDMPQLGAPDDVTDVDAE